MTRDNRMMRCLAMIIVLFCSVHVIDAADDQVEVFKKYLSNRPCISRILYSEMSCQGTEKRSLVAGWCGSSFYVRQVTGRENIDVPISETNRNWSPLYVGCLGDTRWQIAGYNLTLSVRPNLQNVDPYAGMSDAMQIMLGGVIALGSQHVQPGSFVWSGTNFTVQANPLGKQFGFNDFKGWIVVLNGRVVRMVIRGSGMWDYKYSTNVPTGLPSEIINLGGNEACASKILIKEITFASESEEMNIFDPRNHIDKSVTILKGLSNGIVTVKPKPNSKVAEIAKQEMAAAVHSEEVTKHSMARQVTIAAVVLVSAGFLIAATRRASRAKKNST